MISSWSVRAHVAPVEKQFQALCLIKEASKWPSPFEQTRSEQLDPITSLGRSIGKGADQEIYRLQETYIQHCVNLNGCGQTEGHARLKARKTLPNIADMGEPELVDNQHQQSMGLCRRYIGQITWLSTRTRPDVTTVLGIEATHMVSRPTPTKQHVVHLWQHLWTTKHLALHTLPCKASVETLRSALVV